MRNATTVRIFAVLIGFVLALPAVAEAQNSSTLKTEPVSSANVASSCSSASTLVGSTNPAFSDGSVGFSTPLDADPLAIFSGTSQASTRICVAGDCWGQKAGTKCNQGSGTCKAYNEIPAGWECFCYDPPNAPTCHGRRC